MAILEVEGLKKSFDELEVLKGIDFSLEKGEVLSLIGASGSGKTTLLRCLNFLETPTAGKIRVNGNVIYDSANSRTLSEREIRKNRLHFGMVFQQFNLFPQYTALKNITLAAELLAARGEHLRFGSRKSKSETGEIMLRGRELLKKVGLLEKQDFYPHQLSGGQQQRVAIARALMLQPDILCFDEPTSALDPELTGEVLKVIRGLADQNTTMVIVTHEMKFARDVSSQILFMDNGYIVERGAPADVFENPQEERTRQFLQRYFEE